MAAKLDKTILASNVATKTGKITINRQAALWIGQPQKL